MKPEIDKKKCIKCMTCLAVCPRNAISDEDGPKISYEKCNRCLLCLRECPESAISEVEK